MFGQQGYAQPGQRPAMSENMKRPPLQFEIDGRRYEMGLYLVERGLSLSARLLAIGGAPFAKALDGALKSGIDLNFDFKDQNGIDEFLKKNMKDLSVLPFGEALTELGANLHRADVVSFVRDLLQGLRFLDPQHGGEVDFNTFFVGDYLHLYKVIGKVIQLQLLPFLSGLPRPNAGSDLGAKPAEIVTRAR